MTDTFNIDAMKRDMEAGTPGKWVYEPTNSFHESYVVKSVEEGSNGATVCAGIICGPDMYYNASRIARVPEMEAEILRLRDALATIRKHGLQDAVDACHARADMITAFDMDCCEGTARNCADDITALMQEEPSHD